MVKGWWPRAWLVHDIKPAPQSKPSFDSGIQESVERCDNISEDSEPHGFQTRFLPCSSYSRICLRHLEKLKSHLKQTQVFGILVWNCKSCHPTDGKNCQKPQWVGALAAQKGGRETSSESNWSPMPELNAGCGKDQHVSNKKNWSRWLMILFREHWMLCDDCFFLNSEDAWKLDD